MSEFGPWRVRPYQPADRAAARWICCETGFVGEPMEKVVLDREVFADMWSAYWTDREPESAFAAECNGQTVGYLLGCLDTDRQEKIFNSEMARPLFWKAVRRGFFIRGKNPGYVFRLGRSLRRGEFKAPMKEIKAEYPAHLHMNIAPPEHRGRGMGQALLQAYLKYLRAHGVKGLHLGTTSHNQQAVPFYLKSGFQEIFRSRITCYDHAVPDPPVFLIYFGMKL
jgi:GNAT superfamily N-acetyltransferase